MVKIPKYPGKLGKLKEWERAFGRYLFLNGVIFKRRYDSWKCGFDIKLDENWPRFMELLKAHDNNAVEDFMVYTSFVIHEADEDVVRRVKKTVKPGDTKGQYILYNYCAELLVDTYHRSIANIINDIKNFECLANAKNALKNLYTLRSNNAIDKAINKYNKERLEISIDDPENTLPRILMEVHEIEEGIILADMLSRLSEESRFIINMKYYNDCTMKLIANMLSVDANTAKSRRDKNLTHLRQIYEAEKHKYIDGHEAKIN